MKKCKCGVPIMDHWKRCNDCTKPIDVIEAHKTYIPLRQQKIKAHLARIVRLYETLMVDFYTLEDQYNLLKDNFEKLVVHKVKIAIEKE